MWKIFKIKANDKFCCYCGHPLAETEVKQNLEQQHVAIAKNNNKRFVKYGILLTGFAIILFVILIGLIMKLCDVDKYDGIWACSSILHLSKDTLADVLKKMAAALKDSGVIYTSFKYGEFEGERNGRYFTDFTIEAFKEYLQNIPELQIEEYWITGDVRPGRGEEKWLNLILRKSDIH